MYWIVDDIHLDGRGVFPTLDAALGELDRLARIPWDDPSNRAPCLSWQDCGRDWELSEWDESQQPAVLVRRLFMLHVSASGRGWSRGPNMLPTDDVPPRRWRARSNRTRHEVEPVDRDPS